MATLEEFSFQPIRDKYADEFTNKVKTSNTLLRDLSVVHPSNFVLFSNFKNYMQKIQDFKVYPDDTWLLGFPKNGTTWAREMVWLLSNDLDFKKATSDHSWYRFHFLEGEAFKPELRNSVDETAQAGRPRFIMSHLPVPLLPKEMWIVKPKIIHMSRDPRDVAISYYHHHRFAAGYFGILEDFTEVFLADRVPYGPFWSHVSGFYKLKNEPYILLNTYEEMKKDLSSVIRKTAEFLGVRIKDHEIEQLKEHLSLKNMKKNPSCNKEHVIKFKDENDANSSFIRKGESGGWKKIFTEDLIEKFDAWNEKCIKAYGFDKNPWN